MATITEARNVKPGDYVHPDGSDNIREVYKVTNCNRVEDLHTGKLRYTHRRLWFSTATNSTDYVEHNAETMIVTY